MEDSNLKHLFWKATDERALMSYSFKRIDNFYTIISKMDEKDFLYPEHSTLFVLLKSLLNKGVEKFDITMLVEVARNEGCLQSIGGIDYLQTINNMEVADGNFNVYMNNVLEASTKYQLHCLLKEGLAKVVDNAKDGLDSADLMGAVENNILNLSTESKAVNEPKDFADGLVEYIEERKENRIEQIGLSTGHVVLDKQIDGLVPATLFVIGARMKEGKSAFLTNMALHVAFIEEKTVLYIDTEMPYQQWRPRAVSAMSGVKERQIIHGGYSDEVHRQIVKRCIERVDNSKLFHEYMPGYSVDKIIALYKKYKVKHDLGLIMFDYLKEPDSHSVDRQRKEYQLLGDVTTALKDLAGELNIPAVTAVQLNRAKEIADSDRIARYADIIGLWSTRDKEEIDKYGLEAGSHKLVVQNSRRGGQTPPLGIGYHFFKEQLRIKEVGIEKQAVDYSRVINEGSAFYDDETPI
jgi:replicative DNA helicase